MRGQASTRGFPNCAMSLSVIDRFASAINTGHQALTTLYSSLSPTVYPRPTTHVHIPYNPSLPLSLSYDILHHVYRSYPRVYVYVCVYLCLFHSLVIFPLLSSLSFALSQRGVENLDLQKSVRGRTWRSFHPLSILPFPSGFSRLPVFSSCCPLSPHLFYRRFQTMTMA